jgi:hypothetical protein
MRTIGCHNGERSAVVDREKSHARVFGDGRGALDAKRRCEQIASRRKASMRAA